MGGECTLHNPGEDAMRHMRCLCILAVSLALTALVGCGRERGRKPVRIAVVPKGTTVDFWLSVKAGAEKAGEEEGVEIIWRGPAEETDVAGQMAILENFISSRVNAIVMAACDSKAMLTIVEKARKADIPLITIDSGVEDESVPFIATDNEKGAALAARTLVKLIGGKGKVGLIPFVPGAATSIMREEGFRKEIKKHPGVRLVRTIFSHSDVAKGMSAAEDMLTAVPDLKGIFAANEPGAIGAAQALEQRGVAGKVKLVAFDAADSEIEALKRGTIQALIVQNPFKMGYEGVRAAMKALRGEQVPKRVDTGVTVVTRENLGHPDVVRLLAKPGP